MNVLASLGTFAVYFWVVVTLLLGALMEVAIMWLCFAEYTDRRDNTESPPDDDGDDQPFG